MFSPSDYAFELPAELIAQEPAAARDASRLLHVGESALGDHRFGDLVELVPRDAVVVANDTRVIPARVLGKKDTGGNVELLFLEPEGATIWRCLARARRPLHPGQIVRVADVAPEVGTDDEGGVRSSHLALEIASDRAADGSILHVRTPIDTLAFLDRHGHIPLRTLHRPRRHHRRSQIATRRCSRASPARSPRRPPACT